MKLPPEQVARFYSIWLPLLAFVNQRLQVVPSMSATAWTGDAPIDVNAVAQVRDALWGNDHLLDEFIAANPAGLSAENLAIATSWKQRQPGPFYLLRNLKKHSLFVDGKSESVYGVLGLASPIEEVVPFVPCYVQTSLLPFQDCIIYDRLLNVYNIHFGGGIRRNLEQIYKDAKERGAIITSLQPATGLADPEEEEESARTTNAKVLQAFRPWLFRSNLSEKVVDRDLANVTAFAEGFLLTADPPLSLREFGYDEVKEYLADVQRSTSLKEKQKKEIRTSMKRFIKFLVDSERMRWDHGKNIQEDLL